MIYLIGSLRNPRVPDIAARLRSESLDIFDDWYAAGPCADDCWKVYEQGRGHTYVEALQGRAARHIFDFDKTYLDRASAVILLLPAGRSGHLELGYALGRDKPGYVILDTPNRWDVMYQFAAGVYLTVEEFLEDLRRGAVVI